MATLAKLEASKIPSTYGVTTGAQWVTAMKTNLMLTGSQELDTYLDRFILQGWYKAINTDEACNPELLFPALDTPELGVGGTQEFVSNTLSDFMNSKHIYRKHKKNNHCFIESDKRIRTPLRSTPDPFAFNKVSFGTRKPDIVSYVQNYGGVLAIDTIGDVKRGDNDKDLTEE